MFTARYGLGLYIKQSALGLYRVKPQMEYKITVTLLSVCAGGLGRDSVVGVATGYGLDGPGIESRQGGGRFSAFFFAGIYFVLTIPNILF